MPLSPTQALVTSWHDGPDPSQVVGGHTLAAMSINHYTARQASDWVPGCPSDHEGRVGPRTGADAYLQLVDGSW
jgi:hypothetical protein